MFMSVYKWLTRKADWPKFMGDGFFLQVSIFNSGAITDIYGNKIIEY